MYQLLTALDKLLPFSQEPRNKIFFIPVFKTPLQSREENKFQSRSSAPSYLNKKGSQLGACTEAVEYTKKNILLECFIPAHQEHYRSEWA